MQHQVILCEPHCTGVSHSGFNAALVCTVSLAFPEHQLVFLGQNEHVEWVRKELEETEADLARRVHWRSIPVVPETSRNYLADTGTRLRSYHSPFRAARSAPTACIILCSFAPKGLLAVKLLMLAGRLKAPVFLVTHNVLQRITDSFDLRFAMALPSRCTLRYLVLGPSIERALISRRPALRPQVAVLDLPSLRAMSPAPEPDEGGKVTFGFFGVSLNKGFESFAALAERVHTASRNAEFVLVGYLNNAEDPRRYAHVIRGAGVAPISAEEYHRRARSVTYAVITADPADYDLRASASFVDALAHGKPGIFLRNAFIERYFEECGDLGYLCNDLAEMEARMIDCATRSDPDAYRRHRAQVLKARERFSPKALAPALRGLVRATTNPEVGGPS